MNRLICGIIDLGSNTIRLSIFEYNDSVTKLLLNKKTVAGLSGYVVDGALSYRGIEKACHVLNNYKNILSNFFIENAYVFATASLRNISNTDEAVRMIRENTGFFVDVLSGEEEAGLGFFGAISSMGQPEGMLLDIGGGSTEAVAFKEGEIIGSVSLPVGSLNLFIRHVPVLLPTSNVMKEIRQHALLEIRKAPFFKNQKQSFICGIGGTVRAVRKLYNDLYAQPSDNLWIDVGRLEEMLVYYKDNSKSTARRILQLTPDRIHTIIPGLILLSSVAKIVKCEKIVVSKCGIREGYLYHKVLKIR